MGIAEFFNEAKATLVDSAVYADLLQTSPASLSEYRAVIARAMVALAIHIGEQQTTALLPDALLRDKILTLLTIELGDGERSLIGDIAKVVVGSPFTQYLRRWRGKYTDAAYPFAGDILLYQAHGDPIRHYIRECIEQAAQDAPPVVLLAHSLGGIVCLDLLIQQEVVRQQVQVLITVGTQAPFLYEIGALQSLPFGSPLPTPFPRWVNIYDQNDFLSYTAARLFSRAVTDIQVQNHQPFPQAHSAYWTNKHMWEAIVPWLP